MLENQQVKITIFNFFHRFSKIFQKLPEQDGAVLLKILQDLFQMCLTRFPSIDMDDIDEPALAVEVIPKASRCKRRLFEDDDTVHASPLKRKKNRSE